MNRFGKSLFYAVLGGLSFSGNSVFGFGTVDESPHADSPFEGAATVFEHVIAYTETAGEGGAGNVSSVFRYLPELAYSVSMRTPSPYDKAEYESGTLTPPTPDRVTTLPPHDQFGGLRVEKRFSRLSECRKTVGLKYETHASRFDGFTVHSNSISYLGRRYNPYFLIDKANSRAAIFLIAPQTFYSKEFKQLAFIGSIQEANYSNGYSEQVFDYGYIDARKAGFGEQLSKDYLTDIIAPICDLVECKLSDQLRIYVDKLGREGTCFSDDLPELALVNLLASSNIAWNDVPAGEIHDLILKAISCCDMRTSGCS